MAAHGQRAACGCLLALACHATAFAQVGGTPVQAAAWPPHIVLADGTEFGLNLKFQRDANWFSDDAGDQEDPRAARRHELGLYVKKPGIFDADVAFDFLSDKWLDVFLRAQTRPLAGLDLGAIRFGYTKTPVGFEGNTGTGSTTFLETALATQAIFAGRRIGVDWALLREHWVVNAGYYFAGDLQGGSDSHGSAARVAWVPRNQPGDVLHLGVSASRERPEWTTDGRGISTPPTARLQAEPEASLVDETIVDSGALAFTRQVRRQGFEALVIRGAFSLQGEWLAAHVDFRDGKPAYDASGYYVFASWVATGESRRYASGNVADVIPRGRWGALELAARYSEVNLDDGAVAGGRVHQWTLGANWYIDRYLKLQANWVHGSEDRGDARLSPNIVELRLQLMF
jgi:phosphate-selective porin OprO/OprP